MKELLKRMTLKEKIALCSGADFWSTKAMEKYGILSIVMSDGPHGLRKQEDASDMMGINRSVPATCFPAAVSTACSWDEELLGEIARAIAGEAAVNDVSIVLGPGANIKRNPLCGRNFEYFSEDPYLAGKLAASFIRSMEGMGICTSLKHFACNNQEYKRFSSDSILDERTLREIYLTGFEIAVKEGKPSTVMCAYNKLNGRHCSDNRSLLTDILRTEWGFDGVVVTDWGAMANRIRAFQAGCDLCMPGGSDFMEKEAAKAVEDGTLAEADVDTSTERILKFVEKCASPRRKIPEQLTNSGEKLKEQQYQFANPGGRLQEQCQLTGSDAKQKEQHYQIALRAAEESAVLLKNEDNLLPLDKKEDEIVLIGHMAKELRYQGAGSSHINPWKLTNVVDVCPETAFVEGCDADGRTTPEMLEQAVTAAERAKAAIVFAGLTDQYESEGFDRENMRMPVGHCQLIEAVSEVNKNTVVVLLCGSAVETPWADKVKSILYMGLPGEAGGEAIANLLFGRAVPGGKLAESWPYRYEDCISSGYYAGKKKDAHYREGLYVGYRYYSSADIPVRYPFGFGLSYTTFSYSDLEICENCVRCRITNTGTREGKEVVQLYIAPPEGRFYRPVRELKGFCKVFLKPSESKTVEFVLDKRSFAIWNDGWIVPDGTYTIWVGSSSENLLLLGKIRQPETGSEASDILECESSPKRALPGKEEAPEVPAWYFKPEGAPSHEDFEKLVGRTVTEKTLRRGEFTMENTILEMRDHALLPKIIVWAMEIVVARMCHCRRDYSNPEFRMMMSFAADSSLSGMKICGGMKNHLLEILLRIVNGRFRREKDTF